MEISRNKIGVSLIWNFGEKLFTQGIQLLISIVLARILLPEDYGILALVTVFINIMTIIVETGLGSAIIQKKNIDKKEINQLFSINLFVSVVLYIGLFFLSPFIAKFYDKYDSELLVAVLRVYSLILPIGAFTSIQSSIIYRKFDFKKLFFINITTVVLSGAVGIVMARLNFGVWALVSQQVMSKFVLLIILLFVLDWKPRLKKPDKETFTMMRYSLNILGNRLIIVVYNQIRSLFIGKIYNADSLAFYNKGETFPSMIATNTDYALQKVMFSAYSKVQDDIQNVKSMVRRTISLSTFVLMPLMLGFAATADKIVLVVLTEKWMQSVDYMRFFCLIYLLQPIKTSSAQALNGIGKSNVTLRIGILSKIIGIAVLIPSINISVKAIVIGAFFTEILSLPIYFYANKKYVTYSLKEQFSDLLKNLIPSLIMAVIVFFTGKLLNGMNTLLLLIIQVAVGGIVYLVMAVITKNESFNYILDWAKKIKGAIKK